LTRNAVPDYSRTPLRSVNECLLPGHFLEERASAHPDPVRWASSRELGNLEGKQQWRSKNNTQPLSKWGAQSLGIDQIRKLLCRAHIQLQAPQPRKKVEGFVDRAAASRAVSAMHLLLHQVGDEGDGAGCSVLQVWNTLSRTGRLVLVSPRGWSSAHQGH
jgi:hypothetical protein